MKKLILILLITSLCYPLISQVSAGNATATLTSSSRLFENPDDLTSVILVIPKGSQVSVIGSDSSYLHVIYEEDEGFINRRHAVIDKKPVAQQQTANQQTQPQTKTQAQPQPQPQKSRFAWLESKYGTSMAARIYSGKIWKGMNAEMVRDSWGKADKITREISGNTVKEEWIYKSTWLYMENNTLVEWGPVVN